jgi:5-methylcytosine-specific restriction endonuclease McrA
MADHENTPTLPAIISCAEAFARGLRRYFTGEPCFRGHLAERNVNGLGCVACFQERYQANAEAKRAKVRAYEQSDPEAHKKRRALYRAKNWKLIVEQQSAWQAAHPEQVRQWRNNRRAREMFAEGRHTAEDIRSIYKAQRGKCAGCGGKTGDNYQVDHIKALSRGGSNWPANLQILCPTCNQRKGARDAEEFMRSQGFLL